MDLESLNAYASEEARPKPKATINSYRSFGYTLQTAVADIVDNSISAGAVNIWIDYFWAGRDSGLVITDDGTGMDLMELVDALTPGSKDPESERGENDLGRFGMGLKTASFSQCKRLTVATKKAQQQIVYRCWDLDYVNKVQNWILLNYLSQESMTDRLNKSAQGTVVIWEKLDKLVGNASSENDAVRRIFQKEMEYLEVHLGMIFHRFLENKKIKLWLNSVRVEPWNPFMLKAGSVMLGPEYLGKGNTEVRAFILPHMSRLDEQQRKTGQGPKGWYEQQGFYIYRNQRMLVAGDWLGMFTRNEHSKLARLSIDFTNDQDHEWVLDIKKSTAKPPVELRKDLARLGSLAVKESAKVYNFRGTVLKRNPELPEFEFQPVWKAEKTREDGISYTINRAHPVIKQLTGDDSEEKSNISQLLKLIEKNIPIETIIYYQSEDPGIHELRTSGTAPDDAVIALAVKLFDALIKQGVGNEIAVKQILNIEPFNQYPQLIEYLK
ncbi:ATP-binding protein [Mucilaginibacter gotjawali]|uniref:Uncharacterized protein n=2 Tax=Mucilaginibacter gotjawali TaxID=1550579 RepID=A0A839S8J0_9SPHI|nr:ATP-binding protein [Mucilaginibacter gotjawali]MBB3054275.1 hypothetical protein [Mucilaginibacter gotjawali]BAU51890.1 hypothetical protein MgSA37_00039 [Mucilaginibacter gotjawali]